MDNESKTRGYNQGVVVLIALAIFTAIEFGVAQGGGSGVALTVIALIKAGIIIQYFMHVGRIADTEDSH
jgi:heme/copper-type cytochrome/quinol oxidase subunit 4